MLGGETLSILLETLDAVDFSPDGLLVGAAGSSPNRSRQRSEKLTHSDLSIFLSDWR